MQRITRYPLILKEAMKNFKKAECTKCVETIEEAYNLTMEISKYSDDMMEAGKIKNLDDSLHVRTFGLLEMKEIVRCYQRQDRKSLGGPWEEKNCVLFVFTKCIIIAEMVNDELKYWKSFKVSGILLILTKNLLN